MKQLLTEYLPLQYDPNIISEAAGRGAPIVLRNVVLQRANAKNQNGRIYPIDVLQREAKKYETLIQERRATGELDHPESPVVNLKNVSHNVTKVWFKGEDLMGDIEILNTPSGNILRNLLEANIRLGISSRGLGSVVDVGEDTVQVQDDFSLICFDVVSNPSTQGAFINESADPSAIKKATRWQRVDELIYDLLSEMNCQTKVCKL